VHGLTPEPLQQHLLHARAHLLRWRRRRRWR
jgi:hypothetical protein